TGVHDLDRDGPVEPGVQRLVHAGHAAAGDAGPDPVAPLEQAPGLVVLGARGWFPGVAAARSVIAACALVVVHSDPPVQILRTGRGSDRRGHRTASGPTDPVATPV